MSSCKPCQIKLGAFIHESINFQLSQHCASMQVILIFLKLIPLWRKHAFGGCTWLSMVAFSHLPWVLEGLFLLSVNRETSDQFFLTGKKCAIHGAYCIMSQDTKECHGEYKDTLKPPELLLSVLAEWINQVSFNTLYFVYFSLIVYFNKTSLLQ